MKQLTVILSLFSSFALAQHHTGPPKKDNAIDDTDFTGGDQEIVLPKSEQSPLYIFKPDKTILKPYEKEVKKIPSELDSINQDKIVPCPDNQIVIEEDKPKE